MTKLYIVRHGQSQANANGILQGSKVDTPLTQTGIKQAFATKEALSDVSFSKVVASPLLRAAQTATIIAGADRTITFDPRLVEYDYGNWDGMLEADVWAKFPQYFDAKHNLLPNSWETSGGNTYDEVKAKIAALFGDLVAKYPDEAVLVVSHGFTIKLMLDYVLGINNLVNMNEPLNAAVSLVELTDSSQTLVYFNR